MELFLSNIPLDKAINIVRDKCNSIKLKTEYVDTRCALERITSQPVFAKISSPHFIASAMDGIATKFTYTLEADINKPLLLTKDKYAVVDTGDPIEEPFDSVIMIEDVHQVEDGVIIRKPAVPYQNIRPIGEDIQMGEMILPANHKIRAVDISSLLAGGVNEIPVYEKIKVGIIPTGDELVDAGMCPKMGELIDYNSWTFAAMVQEWSGEPIRYDIVKDDIEELKKALQKAVSECHLVIVNAGSAKGRGDFAEHLLNSMGVVYFHGVSIKPGRPASFALINNKPVFGVPGYPVSAFFVMDNIVKSGFYSILNRSIPKRETVEAVLSRKVVSSLKNDEFIRVKLGKVKDKLIASPIGRGAGVTMSLTRADGVFVIDKNSEGYEAGEKIIVETFKDISNINKTLVSIGSHDVIMDIISNLMRFKGFDLSSTHTGSMGGIMALKRGETHIAPIHLLDQNGEYNVSYVRKYLGDYVIMKIVKRVQGLMVKKGNPLNIKDFNDLTRVRFVNRQKGSGTRLLLDHYLVKHNIDAKDINGYDREEITHLTVAAQIAGGSADCGMGVLSAANYMDLDFIPLCSEEYDIAFSRELLEDERFKAFHEVVTSKEFKNQVEAIGGYDFSNIGQIVFTGGKLWRTDSGER
jgi:putative molybdopterin biosynthesis protein